ncbi:pneumococcal-type histidine triad protein [Streptococcus pluranimalium]
MHLNGQKTTTDEPTTSKPVAVAPQVNPTAPTVRPNKETEVNVPAAPQFKTFDELLAVLHTLPLSNRHQEGDGLVFEPNHVIRKTNRGYVVPHGNHYHVIPASKLSALEIQLAEMHLNGQKTVPTSTQEQPNKDSNKDQAKPVATPEKDKDTAATKPTVDANQPNKDSDNKDQTKPVVTPEKDKDAAATKPTAPESSSDGAETLAPSTNKDKEDTSRPTRSYRIN